MKKKPMRLFRHWRGFALLLCLSLIISAWAPSLLALPPSGQTTQKVSWLAEKTDALLVQVADQFQKQATQVAEHLRQGRYVQFQIKTLFYDRHLRRIFMDYSGAALFTGKFPFHFDKADYYFTSDGNIAYDFTIEKLDIRSGRISFSFHGDLVVSLDKLLYELAETLTKTVTAVVCHEAGESLLAFLEKFNGKFLAQAVTKTFEGFSKDALAVTGAELMDNANRVNNLKVKSLVEKNLRDGTILTFLAINLVKISGSTVAGMTGASLGAVVGNAVLPGVGGVVGAYLGTRLFTTIVNTVVHKLTVDLPVRLSLQRILHCSRDLQEDSADATAKARLNGAVDFVFNRIKPELDKEEYGLFDKTLGTIGGFPSHDRRGFAPLLEKFQDYLRFKVLEEKDWYASKKFYQLKQRVTDWDMLDLVKF